MPIKTCSNCGGSGTERYWNAATKKWDSRRCTACHGTGKIHR